MSTPPRATLATNNLDLVRFLLASVVFLVHCHVLSGEPALAPIGAVLSSDLAVKAFFVVSGLLIAMSYERSKSLGDYAAKRIRRIYPAYATVILVAAVGLFAFSSADAGAYFSTAWWRYLIANLAFANFIQPTLPGVFDANPFPEVNGALWTLKIEAAFYLLLPLIVMLGRRFGHWPVLALTYAGSAIYVALMTRLASETGEAIYLVFSRQVVGQLAYFVAGMALYYGWPLLERRLGYVVTAGVVLWLAGRMSGVVWLEPLWIAAFVAAAGFGVYLGNFGRYGDFSYGVYIVHFPIVQLLVQAGLFRASPIGATVIAAVLVLGAAFAMWRLVERPWLGRGSHYVRQAQGTSSRL